MRQKTGFPPPYLVTSALDQAETARRDEVARLAIGRIEECRAGLVGAGHDTAVKILDIALLELSTSIHGVSDDELKSITEALRPVAGQPPADREDRA